VLNRALSRKFEKWCKFLSRVTGKTRKNKSHKKRPPCNRHAIIQGTERRREQRGIPHTHTERAEKKKTIQQNLLVYPNQNFVESRDIFTDCRACLKATGRHFETLPMKSCNLTYRINTDYELQAEAGYVCNEVLAKAGVLRPEIKYSLRTRSFLFSFYRQILEYIFFHVNFILNYVPSCLLKILMTVTAICLSFRFVSFFLSLCKNSYFGVKCYNRFLEVINVKRCCTTSMYCSHFPNAFFPIIEFQRYLSRPRTNANLLFRPVVPKVRSTDPKGSGTSSQGIRGYISVITTLKIVYLYN
jgi:hypothetical protein